LVIYDSVYGNTERIAQAIGSVLGERADVHLATVGQDGPVHLHSQSQWNEFELVVMGGPIHRVSLSAAMKALLKKIPKRALRGASVAVFETCYRDPAWQRGAAAREMGRKARKFGGQLVAPAESFFFVVGREGPLEEGEEGRARQWARAILDRMGSGDQG
jgi:menaquinone-dependent protoporphyrinogen IX oxidase